MTMTAPTKNICSEDEIPRPEIFSYEDYRQYLKDWYGWKKNTTRGFSFRTFSREAGFKSSNALALVISRDRHLALSAVKKFAKAMKLKPREKEYFFLLVQFDQETDPGFKANILAELSTFWDKQGHELTASQYEYIANWHNIAVREMVDLKDFRPDPFWISKKLRGKITPQTARKSLELLQKLGLISKKENDRFVQNISCINTGPNIGAMIGHMVHRQMMQLGFDALVNTPSTERHLDSLSISVTKDDFEKIRMEILSFINRIIALLEAKTEKGRDEELYQMNLHFFPLTSGFNNKESK